MKRLAWVIGLLASVSVARADVTINNLSAAGVLGGSEAIPIFQTANPAVRTTPGAIKVFINGAANNWTGTFQIGGVTQAFPASGLLVGTTDSQTLTNKTLTAPTVTGSFTATGLVTNADLVNSATTVNGQTCTLGSTCTVTAVASSFAAGTTLITSGTAPCVLENSTSTTSACLSVGTSGATLGLLNGALTFSGADIFSSTVKLTGISAGTQVSCLGLDSSNFVVLNAAACGSSGGSVSVTASTANIVVNPSPGTGTFTIGTTSPVISTSTSPYIFNGTGTSGTGTQVDNTYLIETSGAAMTLPQAGTTGFASGVGWMVVPSVTTTITPTTSTIGGLAALSLAPNQFASIGSDGTNYPVALGMPPSCTQNLVIASPNGSTGQPKCRALVVADIPTGTSGAVIGLLNGNLTFGGNDTFSGTLTAPSLSTVGTIAGSLCQTSSGLVLYEVGVNCFAGGSGTINSSSASNFAYYSGSTTISGASIASGALPKSNGASAPTASAIVDNGSKVSISEAALTTPSALTDGATIATNAFLSDAFTVTIAGNRTLSNPTNLTAGQSIIWAITEDGTGGRTLALDTAFTMINGGTFTMNAAASAKTVLACYADTTSTLQCSGGAPVATVNTGSNCSSAAAPAVCASASAGSVAIPTGTNPTLTVNTTAVTANSQILLAVDESLGTKLSVTCNTTISTLTNPVVTARTAATSFTIQIGAIITVNPACVSYLVIN